MKFDYRSVLIIGPHYKNHRGGIGAVLEEYSRNVEPFPFLSSYDYGSKLQIVVHFIVFLLRFTRYLIFNRNIKIVHIHCSSRGSFLRKSIIVLLAKLFGKKTILHMHGSRFDLFYKSAGIFKAYIRMVLRLNDRVICLSPQWFTFFSRIAPADRLRIVCNPVGPAPEIKKTNERDYLQFLFLGRIGKRKGIFDILTALKNIAPDKRSRIRLIAGGDGEIEKFHNTVSELGLAGIVEYTGWVNGHRKVELLETSDIYILPSYQEGLPVSILEAMAYQLSVISSPVGGIPEIVKDGINGFLVEPGNILQLENAIEKMIDHPLLVSEQGKRSAELVKPYFSKAVFPVLDILYEQLLNGSGRHSLIYLTPTPCPDSRQRVV
jgi:glycosyltransferase involved in cell wall biosynthesis